jgi:hypothetical protein
MNLRQKVYPVIRFTWTRANPRVRRARETLFARVAQYVANKLIMTQRKGIEGFAINTEVRNDSFVMEAVRS